MNRKLAKGRKKARAPRKGQGKKGQEPSQAVPQPSGYRLLLLAGIPGSGKSTFASILSGRGWTIVNQDTLGSRKKCEQKAREFLKRGERVIVDRCNFDQSQRVKWTNLAASASLHKDVCMVVWLDFPTDVCNDRVQKRVGHPTLGPGAVSAGIVALMAKKFRPPHPKEGFHDVLRCKGDQDLREAVALLSMTAAPMETFDAARAFDGTLIIAPPMLTSTTDTLGKCESACNGPSIAGAPTVDSAMSLRQTSGSVGNPDLCQGLNELQGMGETDYRQIVPLMSALATLTVPTCAQHTFNNTHSTTPPIVTSTVNASSNGGDSCSGLLTTGSPMVDKEILGGETGESVRETTFEAPTTPLPLVGHPSHGSCEGKCAEMDKTSTKNVKSRETMTQRSPRGACLSVMIEGTQDEAGGPADSKPCQQEQRQR